MWNYYAHTCVWFISHAAYTRLDMKHEEAIKSLGEEMANIILDVSLYSNSYYIHSPFYIIVQLLLTLDMYGCTHVGTWRTLHS